MNDAERVRARLRQRGYIQVSGVHSLDEAMMLAEAGVHAVGFPLRLAVHEPDVSEQEAARIALALKPVAVPVCVTYLQDPDEISAFCGQLHMEVVQLHGDMTPDALARLRALRPDLFIIKSLVVRQWAEPGKTADNRRALAALAQSLEPRADAFILDTHDPATGADGATGKTHNWAISSFLKRKTALPVILAGGLGPHNVTQGIRCVHPDGVDAHTRLEGPDGLKQASLVRRFVSRVRAGYGCCM